MFIIFFYWCYDGSFHLFYGNLYTYFNCPRYKKIYMIYLCFKICHKMFHQWNCQYLSSNDNMFCRLLQPLGPMVYNMVMCLRSNLSTRYLWKLLKITCSLKLFSKGWSFFGLNPCKMMASCNVFEIYAMVNVLLNIDLANGYVYDYVYMVVLFLFQPYWFWCWWLHVGWGTSPMLMFGPSISFVLCRVSIVILQIFEQLLHLVKKEV